MLHSERTSQKFKLASPDFIKTASFMPFLCSFQLERSPTLGSIDTTDAEKRLLAEQSLEFNLRDKIFVELFPGIVEVSAQHLISDIGVSNLLSFFGVMQKLQKELELRKATAELKSLSQPVASTHATVNRPLRPFFEVNRRMNVDVSTLVVNVFVITGFTVFAFLVKYVLKNLNID